MTEDQTTDKVTGGLVPEQRSIGIPVRMFRFEGARDTEKLLIVARQSLMQLRLKRGILGGCQRQLARLDRDEEAIDTGVGLGGAVDSGRTDRQRAGPGLVLQRPVRYAAIKLQVRGQLKKDQMLLRRCTEMRAALEVHTER